MEGLQGPTTHRERTCYLHVMLQRRAGSFGKYRSTESHADLPNIVTPHRTFREELSVSMLALLPTNPGQGGSGQAPGHEPQWLKFNFHSGAQKRPWQEAVVLERTVTSSLPRTCLPDSQVCAIRVCRFLCDLMCDLMSPGAEAGVFSTTPAAAHRLLRGTRSYLGAPGAPHACPRFDENKTDKMHRPRPGIWQSSSTPPYTKDGQFEGTVPARMPCGAQGGDPRLAGSRHHSVPR